MLEGTLSVYVFIVLFPCAVLGSILFLVRYFIRRTVWYEGEDKLDGKTILVTGGTSGLGRALCVELARRGARVVLACRTRQRRDSTAFFLRSKTGSFNVRVMFMDLTNLECVKDFAKEFLQSEDRLDAIINNAAVLCPQETTPDGLDFMLGVNYVGHFFLTLLLADKLRSTPGSIGRIINIVCGGFRQGDIADLESLESRDGKNFNTRQMYRSSKLALYLFNKELARRYRSFDVTALCVDPGPLATTLYKNLPGPCGKLLQVFAKAMYRTTDEGMQSVLYALLARRIHQSSGKVIRDCNAFDVKNKDWNEEATLSLWERTEDTIRSKGITFSLLDDDDEEAIEELHAHLQDLQHHDVKQAVAEASQDVEEEVEEEVEEVEEVEEDEEDE